MKFKPALHFRRSQPYQYSPLNEEAQEVRFLTLLPGAFSSEIRLCLDITPFTESHIPKFEAVSYAWGSTKTSKNIFVGKSGRETLAVTRNLAKALPYFRYEEKPRVLWIDAICVNQQNLQERGHQVKRMAEIYSKAARVLVWLGPGSKDSPIAMDCLDYIASKIEVDYTQTMSATTEEIHWADVKVVPPLGEFQWLPISHLLHRPWFERLWVRQEVYLASGDIQVICGNRTIPWLTLRTAVFCLHTKPKPWFVQVQFMSRLNEVYHLCFGEKDCTISNAIHQMKNCMCSDPRDKIYAILSLLWGASSLEIQPDYTKIVYEVYRDATLSLIEATKELSVLKTVESHEHLERVPSWVPDWKVARPCNPIGLGNASCNTRHNLKAAFEGTILKVEGVAVGLVQEVEPMLSLDPQYSQEDVIREMKRITERAGLQGTSSQSDQHKAFTRVMSGNTFSERSFPTYMSWPTAAQSEKVIHGAFVSDEITELESSQDDLILVIQNIRYSCKGRSFFLTTDRVPGLAPRGAKSGDLVTILLGCDTSMILRPTKEGGFKVIGEAYYDGFMDGESLLGPFPDSIGGIWKFALSGEKFWACVNKETGHFQAEDPRLGPLPCGWSVKSHEQEEFYQLFVNDETGETTWEDPRLTSEALKKRGVPLRVFDLV